MNQSNSITFSLIRKYCPQCLDLSSDSIGSQKSLNDRQDGLHATDNTCSTTILGRDSYSRSIKSLPESLVDRDVLSLPNLNIHEIDGLEIVSHIAELHLSHNHIKEIENIEFLGHLRVLDLSYNDISAASLRESISRLPKSLTSINLMNNPCCEDEQVLCELQDAFPSLGIIVGYETINENELGDESEDSESSEDEEDEEEREEGKAHNDEGSRRMNQDTIEDKPTQDEDIHHYKPLNADDILKQIVERKCRQSTQSFDLESAIQNLNVESEEILSNRKRRNSLTLSSRMGNSITNQDSARSKARVDELMQLSKANRELTNDFLQRLRATSMEARHKIISS